ncbi:MAG TPA: hypothetical protein VFF13_01670 [archaeon]|nr:hypothetical protein [archaeon]
MVERRYPYDIIEHEQDFFTSGFPVTFADLDRLQEKGVNVVVSYFHPEPQILQEGKKRGITFISVGPKVGIKSYFLRLGLFRTQGLAEKLASIANKKIGEGKKVSVCCVAGWYSAETVYPAYQKIKERKKIFPSVTIFRRRKK